jgi:EPS-associated MarR family transcriptional regulator
MDKKTITIDPDIHYRVLNVLEEEPEMTQRELSKRLGVSLGSVNYCIKALAQIGHIKVQNFNENRDKSAYLYILTPRGIKEKAELTSAFLKRKLNEYHQLQVEIESIQSKISQKK